MLTDNLFTNRWRCPQGHLPSQTSNIMKQFTTEQLRNELANRGFQTANLWHIDDVLQNYDCCPEDALYVIRIALNNDYVRECIFEIIDEVCSQEGIKQLNK